MAMFIRQDNTRSELQKKIDADLRAKAAAVKPDGQADSTGQDHYLENTKPTSLRWLVAAIVGAIIIALVLILV